MEEERIPRRRERGKGWSIHPVALLAMVLGWVVLIAIVSYMGFLWWMIRPEHVLDGMEDSRFVLENRTLEDYEPAYNDRGDLLVPVSLLTDELDFTILAEFSDDGDTVDLIWTAPMHVLEVRTGEVVARLNDAPLDLLTPAVVIAGEPYMPAAFIQSATDIQFDDYDDTSRVVIRRPGDPILTGSTSESTHPRGSYIDTLSRRFRSILGAEDAIGLRKAPEFSSNVLLYVPIGADVEILGEEAGWYRVRFRGLGGYAPKNNVSLGAVEVLRAPKESTILPGPVNWADWRPGRPFEGERITLVWEHVRGQGPDPHEIGDLPGVNVVSPTWFSLADNEGRFRSRADREYVDWAHEQGFLVWGLVTNSFDPDLTHEVLAKRETRAEMVRQLIAYSTMYELDGINIDFENVYYEDRDRLTQFVRELAPAAHAQGLTLSIDVTTISTSRTWSMCYDRPALAEIVDYMMLMTYDEHWASSPVAGSVASLPWVERGLRRVLDEVPADKLLLGIPFYTRIWEEWSEGGEDRISSRAVGMNTQREILEEYSDDVVWDEGAGQHYLEYESDGRTYRIWIEDEISLRARLSLVHKYDLAGVAAWRRGLEVPEFWPIIERAMQTWP